MAASDIQAGAVRLVGTTRIALTIRTDGKTIAILKVCQPQRAGITPSTGGIANRESNWHSHLDAHGHARPPRRRKLPLLNGCQCRGIQGGIPGRLFHAHRFNQPIRTDNRS
jgi:hypothetical protein